MALDIIKQKILALYKNDLQLRGKCNDFISAHPLISSYKTEADFTCYIDSLNSIIQCTEPATASLLTPDEQTKSILFELFSETNYVSGIMQCPWDNALVGLIVSIYSPEYYFYSLSDSNTDIILKKLHLVIFTGLEYPLKQTLLKQVYEIYSSQYKISPYMFCNLLIE